MVHKIHVGLQNNKIPALKLVFFIARRFIKKNPNGFSDPIIRIAITAVALGLAVMILSVAIITGFQQEIREKVIGFGGHVQITHFDSNISYEPSPISKDQDFMEELSGVPGIRHTGFCQQAGHYTHRRRHPGGSAQRCWRRFRLVVFWLEANQRQLAGFQRYDHLQCRPDFKKNSSKTPSRYG